MASSSKLPKGDASVGGGFKYDTLSLEKGQDISKAIMEMVKNTSRHFCILNAVGMITVAELSVLQSKSKRYEGLFPILKMCGVFETLDSSRDGEVEKKGGMTVTLADSEGFGFGGRVAGTLVAGGPVDVHFGTFFSQPAPIDTPVPRKRRRSKKARVTFETPTPISVAMPDGHGIATPIRYGMEGIIANENETFKGKGATNHSITLVRGQDIAEAILQFANSIPGDILVLSVRGPICYAEIRSPKPDEDFKMRLKGWFQLTKMSAAYFSKESFANKVGVIAVVLSDSKGDTFGGEVDGPLIAGGHIDLLIMSYNSKSSETRQTEDKIEAKGEEDNAIVSYVAKSVEAPQVQNKIEVGNQEDNAIVVYNAKSLEAPQIEVGTQEDDVIMSCDAKSLEAPQIENKIEVDNQEEDVIMSYEAKSIEAPQVENKVEVDNEEDDVIMSYEAKSIEAPQVENKFEVDNEEDDAIMSYEAKSLEAPQVENKIEVDNEEDDVIMSYEAKSIEGPQVENKIEVDNEEDDAIMSYEALEAPQVENKIEVANEEEHVISNCLPKSSPASGQVQTVVVDDDDNDDDERTDSDY